MKKINYGILSTASIVERFVQGVRASENGQVLAIASRTKGRADQVAKELDIPQSFGSYEELVACPDIHVVYIPTINYMHFENAKLALNHGKHVLVEKPMTLRKEDTIELFELAREKNLFIMEAQKSVFLPITQKVRELIGEGIIGTVHYARYTMSYPDVGFTWFYDMEKGGGALNGNASYILSHSSFILNEEVIQTSGQATLDSKGVDLACSLSMKTSGGTLIQGHVTTLLSMPSKAEIYGEKGMIIIKDFWKARKATILVHGEEERELFYPIDYEMVYEINHVNECLEKGLIISPVMSDVHSIKGAEKVDHFHQDFIRETEI